MASCATCNLCEHPGTFAGALDVASVPCHVRKFKDENFTVWRCRNCGSLHCLEDADLARFYRDYPFKQQRLDFHTRIGYGNRLRSLAACGIRPSDRILDHGCGTGLFVQYLKQAGYPNVFGYDAFADRYADRSVLDGTYDVIVSYDVIEHVDEPIVYLQTILPLLKNGGLLVIGTPNADRLALKPSGHFPPELSQPYHRHILTGKVLVDLAARFGLSVEHRAERWYFDSLYPSVNTRFIWAYVDALGGYIDACIEAPRFDVVLSSPKLLLLAFFGYFFPTGGNILLGLRKPEAGKRIATAGASLPGRGSDADRT